MDKDARVSEEQYGTTVVFEQHKQEKARCHNLQP